MPIAEVWASQFDWRVRYPDASGDLSGIDAFEVPFEFVVPADTDVVFRLRSRDVLHSFFVPAFRLKQDAIPGRIITGWFTPTGTGAHDIQCVEICGIGHGMMGARVLIEDSETHAAWVRPHSPPTLAANTVPERTTGEDR